MPQRGQACGTEPRRSRSLKVLLAGIALAKATRTSNTVLSCKAKAERALERWTHHRASGLLRINPRRSCPRNPSASRSPAVRLSLVASSESSNSSGWRAAGCHWRGRTRPCPLGRAVELEDGWCVGLAAQGPVAPVSSICLQSSRPVDARPLQLAATHQPRGPRNSRWLPGPRCACDTGPTVRELYLDLQLGRVAELGVYHCLWRCALARSASHRKGSARGRGRLAEVRQLSSP